MSLTTVGTSLGNGVLAGAQFNAAKQASVDRSYRPTTIFQSHIEVLRAENGYVVRFAKYQGEEAKLYIAQNAEEIRSFLAAEMALAKLED